jgi:hypothetical protein
VSFFNCFYDRNFLWITFVDPDVAQQIDGFQEVLGRGRRRERQSARMAELILNEQLGSDESGDEAPPELAKPTGKRRKGANSRIAPNAVPATSNSFGHLSVEEASDANDDNYEANDSSSSASSTEIEEITNEEVCESCFLQDTLLIFNISLRTVFRPRQSLVVVLQLVRTERKSPRQARNGRYHQRQQHLRAVSFILRKLVSRMWMMMVIRGLHHQLLRQLNLRALKSRYMN